MMGIYNIYVHFRWKFDHIKCLTKKFLNVWIQVLVEQSKIHGLSACMSLFKLLNVFKLMRGTCTVHCIIDGVHVDCILLMDL